MRRLIQSTNLRSGSAEPHRPSGAGNGRARFKVSACLPGNATLTSPIVRQLLGGAPEKRLTVIYCRVSNARQKNDRVSQVEAMQVYCRAASIALDEWIQEISGRMNFKRKKFLELLDRLLRGEIAQLLIAHKEK